MKKLFVLFAAATLFVGVQACKQNAEEATEAATETATEATEAVTDAANTVADSAAVRSGAQVLLLERDGERAAMDTGADDDVG